MPTYTYKCEKCDHKIDWIHAAGTRVSLECPDCGHSPMTWQFPCPHIQTDSTFQRGGDDGFGNDNASRQAAKAKAAAAGVSTIGKRYCPSLSPLGEQYSPDAWISNKDDARRVCKKHNWDCPDLGIHRDKIEAEPKPYRVADSLIAQEVDCIIEDHGGDVTASEREKLSREVRKRVTPVEGAV